MAEDILFGDTNLWPVLDAAVSGDHAALSQALDRLTTEEIAFVADLGQLLRLRAGQKVSKRIADRAGEANT